MEGADRSGVGREDMRHDRDVPSRGSRPRPGAAGATPRSRPLSGSACLLLKDALQGEPAVNCSPTAFRRSWPVILRTISSSLALLVMKAVDE
ncbi:hypothetical protein AVW11_35190 [Streptomyces amritsarensis]|uniref:Uncharacterized protein n=1 Tax=Streptomyces amritsarensis TaxID=681158 RepID=A0ABX3FUG1_9ACTN|nr:hypothetical protein AVW11_35190 [Streptomyces amritsarensis]